MMKDDGDIVSNLITRSFLTALPMNPAGESPSMQITVTVSDAIVRQAATRSLPVIDFVETLIDRGMIAASDPPVFDSAIERIRRLRAATQPARDPHHNP